MASCISLVTNNKQHSNVPLSRVIHQPKIYASHPNPPFTTTTNPPMDTLLPLPSSRIARVNHRFDFPALLGISLSAPPTAPLSATKVATLIEIIYDIIDYLKNATDFLAAAPSSLEWCLQHKRSIGNISAQVAAIDGFLSALVLFPGLLQNTNVVPVTTETTSLLPPLRTLVLTFTARLSVAVKYDDLRTQSIGAIAAEIDSCADDLPSVAKIKPLHHLPNSVSMKSIVESIQSHNYESVSLYTLIKPTFTGAEAACVHLLEEYEARLDPISVAMQFLVEHVNEYVTVHGSIYPSSASQVTRDFNNLRHNWNQLNLTFTSLKTSLVGRRWELLFALMVDDISALLQAMTNDIVGGLTDGHDDITDDFGAQFKLCSNAITIIRKVLLDKKTDDSTTRERFNEIIVPKWRLLNELLTDAKFSELKPERDSTSQVCPNGLRPVRLALGRTPRAETIIDPIHYTEPALTGIDLQLDVNNTTATPYSVVQNDRILHLDMSKMDINGDVNKRLMDFFDASNDNANDNDNENNESNENYSDDDTDTLVHSRSIDQSDHFPLARLRERRMAKTPCKIPIIQSDYIQKGYPVIKKNKQLHGQSRTQIPSISADHPVFISPQKQPSSRCNTLPARSVASPHMSPLVLLSPPLFALTANKNAQRRVSSSSTTLGFLTPQQRSRASLLASRADKLSLDKQLTPNLTFSSDSNYDDFLEDKVSLRSTSPDRPGSSIGSRFDECHLMQPVKLTKKAWK